ncbi:mediator of RNA polymerase II transcription subunit 13-like isoform X1 [Nicotiana tomentosiformis]|uniref:mediator of RNA polymerase II transcription subunit 13-like isoform X1 n=1 Tax=Nicotiana tomentosiformis TaxID=4098 RepID=UPI00051BE96B|nr:mediator of RNA polymerase II transcription subunit 13-like isoform X1 [Nicotiana tomentosiformis]XP_009596816.1 mediator of RNA polymerase II transcription subunit 13-like isoform X1 [Nicotiana tomentosiformis]XP_009596817.1 mediator of RNA polymerase II transcription subunit 13-like isoform X1 [Nicotiana tomentosiformis]XP_009596818.1 mediator of RNA polymerase II transcription subunit 13-like isoform X1 [Nicotiana tomentosiformis]XP_018625196.1 mediator of RNA polymerase II transcription 
MWTNVFKIGGLHQISWFQFLPHESDVSSLVDKSVKLDKKDAATWLVLSSHLQLQKEGFLSTWTNSFVGPWDPSQGLHNPDEKIKLWLFSPGQHSSVVEKAQSAVSKLRVLASGLWVAPGDSEEVAAALSQALRNCMERKLRGLSYVRYGDVFTKHHPFSQNEELFRKGQPVVEFIFSATEEAIFVHVIISAKLIRALSSGDIDKISEDTSNVSGERLPVIVSPHGMRGRLTGCCPADLVKQVYLSSCKFSASNGIVGLPCNVSRSGYQLKGQNCYVEVSLGCTTPGNNNIKESSRMLIYPPEAILVPVVQTACARSSLKRFWLQNWIGPSLSFTSSFMHCFDFSSDAKVNSTDGSWLDANIMRSNRQYNSSSNSNSSSVSSVSTSSSDSDYKTSGAGDLEADADSLMCRPSGLSSVDQSRNDNLKTGFKRSRTGISESFSQAGAVINPSTSDYASMEVNNSAITGGNDQIGLQWGWDDDDRGVGMDIQALLSEFGDFGDFFENDVLPFGEPPGTAESQALMYPAADSADVGSSPCPSMMDVKDQMLLPVGFPSFDSFNQPPPPASLDDSLSKHQEVIKSTAVAYQVNNSSAAIAGEFDHLIKAEALMTFAPEYGAVETPTGEKSHLIFRNPYLPKSREVDTSNSSSDSYVYSATPPLSPYFDACEEKSGVTVNLKTGSGRRDTSSIIQSKRYYTHIESGKEKNDGKLSGSDHSCATREAQVEQSPFYGFNSTNSVKSIHNKTEKANEALLKADSFGQSMKTVLATEVECLMCQAFMCKIRHTLLSSSSYLPVGASRMSGSTIINQPQGEAVVTVDNMSSKSEMKKKEIIPVRIAGDIDGGLLDGTLNAQVGVWRSVGVSKGMKQPSSALEACHSVQHNSFIEESMLAYGLRQPLQELLDGVALLVQQATSLVDVALDADNNDGPYGWLTLQEQWRRGFSCGPSMVHAGCGGVLASCHSLDIAGVELIDPLSADVQASFALTLLQNDIKTAMKSAFGTMEGPLSVVDWCKGRSQSNDGGISGDGFSAESTASASECRDSSSTISFSVGEPISPSQSSAGGSSLKDGIRVDEASERRLSQDTCLSESEQLPGSRLRPTLSAVPYPAILVGYQDDWLKTSPSSLQLWEKAPFEPYAMPKHMSYYVVCPDINALTTAATDFFQQLGTVYETCKLGTHSPQCMGNEMEIDSGKNVSSGFVLIDCPQSMKIDSSSTSMLGSISDYFLSLSNGWDLESYLKSLSKVLRNLKPSSCMTMNPKEGSTGPCTVIYVVCPFPEPLAVLQTVVESSIAVGSVVLSSDKERRSTLQNQVGKALSYSAAVDESLSNVLTLSGFCIPKLVLQIVTVDAIFRVTSPALSELLVLKEIAFTVYNKARRISRGSSSDMVQSSSMSGRSHPVLMQMTSPVPGMWKDCVGPRSIGTSLQREAELDASLRSGSWDNWQISRGGSLGCDPNRIGDFSFQDEVRYLFEPLYILAEPGSLDRGLSFPMSGNLMAESSKLLLDDGTSGNFMQSSASSGGGDTGPNTQSETSEPDGFGSAHQKSLPSLHCCYGWTEDWRWLVCIWTDSRGELLDNYIYPFGGISSRQDTKGLQSLFVQILQQGCQILQACPPEAANAKPRDFVIARIGSFFELECQEWQKALYAIGGSEVKKWSLQLRRSVPDGMSASSNGTSLQQQEIGLIQERALPSSPSPLYSPHSKVSSFMKGGMGQPSTRKQLIGGQGMVDNSRGLLQWVQSISFVSVSIDHSLQLMFQADIVSHGTSQSSGVLSQPGYLEGYTPVKSLGSTSNSYILIPSPNMRFLPPVGLQLHTCLTAESPPLAHLLHSKGCAIPLSTGFVVSKAVPTMRRDARSISKEEWPSVLSVSLVDYYGGSNIIQEKFFKGVGKVGGRGTSSETRDVEIETHLILENIAAELHALSWMTVSPAYLERRSALPFHCDMVLRLRRLLHFADKEVSRQPEKTQV